MQFLKVNNKKNREFRCFVFRYFEYDFFYFFLSSLLNFSLTIA